MSGSRCEKEEKKRMERRDRNRSQLKGVIGCCSKMEEKEMFAERESEGNSDEEATSSPQIESVLRPPQADSKRIASAKMFDMKCCSRRVCMNW